jgi:hypothetical protein
MKAIQAGNHALGSWKLVFEVAVLPPQDRLQLLEVRSEYTARASAFQTRSSWAQFWRIVRF